MIVSWIVFFLLGVINRLCSDSNTNVSLSSINNGNVFAFVVIILVSMVLMIEVIVLFKKDNALFVSLSYLFRIALLVWDRYFSDVFSLPNSGGDSENFHYVAILKALSQTNSRYGGTYTTILSYIYKLYGDNRIIGQYFNVLLSMSAIYIVYLILQRLDISYKRKRLGLMLMCFAPNYAILSSILLRESPISTLIALSLLFFILYWESGHLATLLISVALCLFAATFHSGAVAPALGYIAAYMLYDRKKKEFNIRGRTVVGLLAATFVFMYLFQRYGAVFFDRFVGKDIEESIEHAAVADRGGSVYNVGIATGNVLVDMIVNTPVRFLYFYMAPMPWDWRGITDIISFFLSSCFYFYGYCAVVKTLKNRLIRKEKKQLVIAMLVSLLAGGIVFAWGTSTAGTALRHRDKFISIYVVMTALSVDCLKGRRRISSSDNTWN